MWRRTLSLLLLFACGVGGPLACIIHCARPHPAGHQHAAMGDMHPETPVPSATSCQHTDHLLLAQLALTIGILVAATPLVAPRARARPPHWRPLALRSWHPPPHLRPPQP